MNKNEIVFDLKVGFNEFLLKYTEIWIGPFSLTNAEVFIINEFQKKFFIIVDKVSSDIELELALYKEIKSIREILGYKEIAFRKHLRNLSNKGVFAMGKKRIKLNQYLIPRKHLEFNFEITKDGE